MIVICLGVIGFTGPASAESIDPANNPHFNCPNGLTLHAGGGPGFRQLAKDFAYDYNRSRRASWPKFVKIVEGDWNGLVWGINVGGSPACTVDFDERNDGDNGIAGFGGLYYFVGGGTRNHTSDAGGLMNTHYWKGGGFHDRYAVYHELSHAMGLGHNFDQPDSVMSYNYSCICYQSDDVNTMNFIHGHTH